MKIGNDSVVYGKVPQNLNIGDRSVIVGATDDRGSTILTTPMAVGYRSRLSVDSIVIGAHAGEGISSQNTPLPSFAQSWPPIRACLQEFTFSDIKEIVGLAGVDLAELAHLDQRPGKNATKGQLMTALDGIVGTMKGEAKGRFVALVIEEALRRNPLLADRLTELLSRLQWSYTEGTLTPLRVFDPGDLEEAPTYSHHDLRKAAARFRDGDLTGAISAACAAVDSATAAIYLEEELGDPTQASFQERCKKASTARGIIPQLESQLRDLGWPDEDILPFRKNYEGAMNQGAYVMQTLRSKMGDVHGSKPIFRPLVFDVLKWSQLFVASLVTRSTDA